MFQITGTFTSLLADWLRINHLHSAKLASDVKKLSNKKFIDIQRWNDLLINSSDEFKRPLIGLEVGQLISLETSGVLGFLIQNTTSFFEAVKVYQQCEHRFYKTNLLEISVEENLLILCWKTPLDESYSQTITCSLAAFISFVQKEFPSSCKLIEVDSCSITNKHAHSLGKLFHCAVASSNKYIKLTFDLPRSKAIEDKINYKHHAIGVYPSLLNAKAPRDPVVESLVSIIKAQLVTGDFNLKYIAPIANTSPRTIQRKLQTFHITFQILVDSIREQMACYYLEQTNLSGTEIALLLGFSEQSAFSRAFKQWKGITPNQYRKALQQH